MSEDNGQDEIMCELIFNNGKTIKFLLTNNELEDDKYTKGIYQYENEKYIQIENWEE